MQAYQVSICRKPRASDAVKGALDLLGGMVRFVKQGERVLIKPNGFTQIQRPGVVTSAAVVAALARLVLEAGGKPIIGENDLVYDPSSQKFAQSCGKHYFDALAAQGIAGDVALVDLMKDEMVEVDFPQGRVIHHSRIARTALTVDKLIDAPLLKTHDQTQVTLGIKNLKGVLPLAERIRYHEENLEQAIVDLCKFLDPDLVVVDGTVAGEGLGPAESKPVKMDLVIAGDNALATDMVGASVMGFEVSRIKFLKYAVADALGPKGLEEVEVVGCPIESVRRQFETAQSVVCRQYQEMGIQVISNNVCSGCWAEFRHIYYSLGQDRTKLAGLTFVLGRVTELHPCKKAIIVGNCAKEVAMGGCFVPGCPPHHFAIEAAARQVSGIGGEPKKLGQS